jgi:hypothetical protein
MVHEKPIPVADESNSDLTPPAPHRTLYAVYRMSEDRFLNKNRSLRRRGGKPHTEAARIRSFSRDVYEEDSA